MKQGKESERIAMRLNEPRRNVQEYEPHTDAQSGLHAVAVAGLAILVSLVLHVIGVLDYPFSSGVLVRPETFEQVLKEIGGGEP